MMPCNNNNVLPNSLLTQDTVTDLSNNVELFLRYLGKCHVLFSNLE